jgi:hypothetical protein
MLATRFQVPSFLREASAREVEYLQANLRDLFHVLQNQNEASLQQHSSKVCASILLLDHVPMLSANFFCSLA